MNERVSITNMRSTALSSSIIAAFSLFVAATPTPEGTSINLITIEQFIDWLANTDSEVTFFGKPLGDLSDFSKRNPLDTVVTYCPKRKGNICTGACNIYSGGATCIQASGTNCLTATNDVGFCEGRKCNGHCHQFSSCGTRLAYNFCYTPGTRSIQVGSA